MAYSILSDNFLSVSDEVSSNTENWREKWRCEKHVAHSQLLWQTSQFFNQLNLSLDFLLSMHAWRMYMV